MNNNSTLFIGVTPSIQLLSIINCMNMLSDILYLENFLQKEEQYQQFNIINALYKYINENNKRKEKLIKQLLNGNYLYGGGENETLDENYIDETFDYIVSNVVFSQYGNIYGYLAKVVSTTNNLSSLYLKIEMYRQLDNLIDLNENGKISHLNELTKLKIAETLIWPLFPISKKERNIIDIDYIYAQAGLILARSAKLNTTRIKFSKLIHLSLPIESKIIETKLNDSFLEIFFLPALLYYAHKEKEIFQKKPIALLIENEKTWFNAFNLLFKFINKTFKTINEKLTTNNLYQFQFFMANYKTRTNWAKRILTKNCPLNKDKILLEQLIIKYKTFPSNTNCPISGIKLPNLNDIYSQHVDEIKEKYFLLLNDFLQEAFDKANLTDLINSSSTNVVRGKTTPIFINCYPLACAPIQSNVKQNAALIIVKHDNREDLYAIVINSNNVTLLNYNDNRVVFVKKLELPKDTEFEESLFPLVLKHSSENFEILKNRIAEEKTKLFQKQLFNFGYEETTDERIIDILLQFVPFYHCIKYSKDGEFLDATLACLQDGISFIPVVGETMKILLRITDMTVISMLKLSGTMLKTLTLRNIFHSTIKFLIKSTLSIRNIIFNQNILKSLATSVIQAIDPGIELSYKILKNGGMQIKKIISHISKTVKKTSLLHYDLRECKKLWQKLLINKRKSMDNSGMTRIVIDRKEGHDVFRYIYPGGNKQFGSKYISLSNGNAELKHIIGFKEEFAVVVSRVSTWGKVYYRKINLHTELPEGIEWTLNSNNVLRPVTLPFREHITIIVTEGLSGKKKIKSERIQQMKKAVEIMTGTKTITRAKAQNILLRYMLTIKQEPIMIGDIKLDTINPTIENSKLMDLNDPNIIQQYLGDDYNKLDKSLDKYLLNAPTYEDFARDWIKFNDINPIYNEWSIPNSIEIYKLLYRKNVGPIKPDFQTANNKIRAIHGDNFNIINEIKIIEVFNAYNKNKANQYISFEDYYSVLLWINNDYTIKNFNYITQLNIRMALNKLTISLIDEDHLQLPGLLFMVQMKDPLTIEKEINELKGETFISNKLLYTTTSKIVAHNYLNIEHYIVDISKNERRKKVPILYEFNLDNKYLTSHVQTVAPTTEFPVVILPDMEFTLEKIEKKIINGKEIDYIKIHNTPITKEVFLLKVMRNIQNIHEKIFELSISHT
ncbi:uncharacterized protein LOC127287625 [Leptopilina boulardi]|uniref:uncharacterized protein LOC127287625 n=1 Tax=Leptopilina boulardi TaxID=63433 RepID=UPI0021F63B3C|nr:uncharacterized protein LOC127287625 [Leptopilina boulardi]